MTTNGTDLTDAEVERIAEQVYNTQPPLGAQWANASHDARERSRGWVRAVHAAVRVQAPSLLEAQRETWDAARNWIVGNAFLNADVQRAWDAERDRRFPLPAPAGVTLSEPTGRSVGCRRSGSDRRVAK